MALERIQKIISESGFCSRRKAEEYIAAGKVTVNGRPCSLGDKADKGKDLMSIDGKNLPIIKKMKHLYVMLNKPRGYVTTMSDEMGRKCVKELVEDYPIRVYPVGRLDKNSEGLLLLTSDGNFANRIMHPSQKIKKVYRVTVREDVKEDTLVELSVGVLIDDRKTLPCDVRVLQKEENRTVLEFIITEGRNRQIRKMCEAVGLTVVRLKRTAIGPIKLGMLSPGETRELTPSELQALRNAMEKNERAEKDKNLKAEASKRKGQKRW